MSRETIAQLMERAQRDGLGSLTPGEAKTLRSVIGKGRAAYAERKARSAADQADMSRAGRDIGELPDVANPARKLAAARDFRRFCETYFPLTFSKGWSADHLRAIARIETVVLAGGLFALAMPRGSGKTSLCGEAACIWAAIYGHRQFVVLIGPTEDHSEKMLESIKTELEGNEALSEDFPEVIFPIRALDGISNRCRGQLYHGERTHVGWTATGVVFPTIPGAASSGAILRVAGLTGHLKGMKHKQPGGKAIRPSLVVVDDPQTVESAWSLTQCASRMRILQGAVLGLAGPGEKLACFVPCTVIAPGDVADQILDRDVHPEWQGERTKLMAEFPTNVQRWAKYAEIRAECLKRKGDISDATAYYSANRAEMDAGAVVAWAERFNADELSAVQNAMNLRLQDEDAFLAEYQNEPRKSQLGAELPGLRADDIASRVNRVPRGTIPLEVTSLVAFVDIMEKALYYCVAGFSPEFTGAVVDYGTLPEQHSSYFTLRDLRHELASAFPGVGQGAMIHAGLEVLVAKLMGCEWPREDGVPMRIGLCLVDANWSASRDVVHAFARRSAWAASIMPSHGRYFGVKSKPMAEYAKRPGDRIGDHWRQPSPRGVKNTARYVSWDVNHWKCFIRERLGIPLGDKGSLTLFGESPREHRMFADHLVSERCIRVRMEGTERICDEWQSKPDGGDNHFFDCIVGCAVAASILGCLVAETSMERGITPRKKRIRLSELQQRRG